MGSTNDPRRVGLCASCKRSGQCRVGIRSIVEQLADRLTMEVTCSADWEGGPGVARGGWTAAMFDDVMGRFYTTGAVADPLPPGHFVVTKRLEIEYVKPVPIEVPLLVRVVPEPVDGRERPLRGELVLADGGAVLGRAHGVWIERDFGAHFAGFANFMGSQTAGSAPGERATG
jgi:acyl-coenzyme A thioesterase PaaI-like protein